MNLSDLVAVHDAILDVLWSCDVPESAIIERSTFLPHRTFAETHIDFETDTHQFWIANRIDGTVKVYMHRKGEYQRQRFTLRPITDMRLGTKFVTSAVRGLIEGTLQPIAKKEKS